MASGLRGLIKKKKKKARMILLSVSSIACVEIIVGC